MNRTLIEARRVFWHLRDFYRSVRQNGWNEN
jgi:hypothetical protein